MSGAAFLFGKLPSRAEFTSRGLPPAERVQWDAWCCAVMADGAARLGEDFEAAFDATAPWHFGLLLAGGSWQAGCIAPACDSHGRRFPLVLGRKGTGAPAPLFLAGMAAAMAEAIQAAFAPVLDLNAFLPACAARVAGPAASAPEMTDWRHDWIGR
ncbi:type VI secretion system-associated protein TagF [Sphingomonas sp. ABOLD]|uniref:Type VI secretion system protein ImpM n=1 Tax=Sphingomonas trueperi TaxID=53317 RepID=A0A7X5XVQ3_9SPHN|nr:MULTISPECIES: type VI secretion system-associated protein TagF [Sphingomonas]NJB95803.1 type VI secretion system protein ImpM [Sphingomonas trueperi]RSV39452.1 type VI secretion system-associated protein TagF [Sphingomonas sp. ABOLE]RSV49220.1 type VI secretion system-associated protein TagF [Sphingomonas sp. ABOLD]